MKNAKEKMITYTETSTTFARESLKSVVRSISNGANRTRTLGSDLKSYLSSDSYEKDLDEIISFLHIHNPSSKPIFNNLNRHERVVEKTQFVKEQAILFVGLSSLAGAQIGATVGLPSEGAVIGTATGVLILTMATGSIVIKRMDAGVEVKTLVLT